jgi:ABC-type branched-subunit amino acid transport system substrate-binding protein
MLGTRFKIRAAIALGAVGLLAAACGSSGDGSSAGTTGAGRSAAAGTPIPVQFVSTLTSNVYSLPESGAAAKAAVGSINQAGGINGHPIELNICDDDFTPNGATKCAEQAVEQNDVASVGSVEIYPNYFPILQEAGIAYIGGEGLNAAELNSSNSFPLSGGFASWYYGEVALGSAKGAKTLTNVCVQTSCSLSQSLLDSAAAKKGMAKPRQVVAQLNQADYSSVAAQAMSGNPSMITISTPATEIAQIESSLKQMGYSGLIVGVAAVYTQQIADTVGSAADGTYQVSNLVSVNDTSNPAVAEFNKELTKQDPSAEHDEVSLTTWTAYQLFAAVAKRLSSVTASSVLAAMKTLSDPVNLGDVPPYSTVGKKSPVPGYTQVFQTSVDFNEVVNGKFTQIQSFVNPFSS